MRTRKLRIGGFKDYPPQVEFSNCKIWSLKHCAHPGSDAELLQIVLQIANIDYEIVQQDFSGTGDDILSLIENGTFDMSIMALRMTEDRYDRVLYTTPINFLKFGYVIREIGNLESDDFLAHTFRPEVYLLCIASVLLMAFAIRVICHTEGGFFKWCWRLLVLFYNQDHFIFKPRATMFVLGGSWILFSFLIVTYYQSKMKSFLTVPLREGVPFNTLQDLLDAVDVGEWVGVSNYQGYDPEMHCKNLKQCERISRLYAENKILRADFDDDRKLYDFIGTGKYVTFAGLTADLAIYDVNVIDKERKIIFIQDQTIALEMLAFVVNKEFYYELEIINRSLDILVRSYGTILNRYTPTYSPFGHASPGRSDSRITISMIHMRTFFLAYLVIIALSIASFGGEHLIYQSAWKKYTLLGFYRRRRRSTSEGVFRRPQMIVLPTHSTYSTYTKRSLYGEYFTY